MMNVKIKYKLFLAIIMANLLVVLAIYLVSSLSFSSSFREYLDANREKELEPFIQAIAKEYAAEQNWEWLKQRPSPRWKNLVDTYILGGSSFLEFLGEPHPPGPPRNRRGRGPERRPPPEGRPRPPRDDNRPGTRPPKLFVADQQQNIILGPKHEKHRVNWIDITLNGQVIGYLGFIKTHQVTSELDRLFIEKLNNNLGLSVVIAILISTLIGLILSRLLTKPIVRLSKATHKLSGGEYTTRIKVTSNDEIGELCKDFNRLAKSLDSNLKARQQWIADISHELRTPVSILQGELEAIQDGIRANDGKTLDSLYQEIKRLAFLINDLHELSMSDIGALTYRFESTDLIEIIDDVIDSKRESIDSVDFSIEHKRPKSTVLINGDLNRLTQLFLNLLNNSLLYSDPGGLIQVQYQCSPQEVTILWSDTAPGVSDEQLQRLFERLYRAESSRNRNSGGSGLGLSISRNIIEAHNGSIGAKHSPLGGVSFVIKLPINE